MNILMSIFESASATVAVTFIIREIKPLCEIIEGMFTVTGFASVNGPRDESVLVRITFESSGAAVGVGVGVDTEDDLISPPPSPPWAPRPPLPELEPPPPDVVDVGVGVGEAVGLAEGEADGLVEGEDDGLACGTLCGWGDGLGVTTTVPPG